MPCPFPFACCCTGCLGDLDELLVGVGVSALAGGGDVVGVGVSGTWEALAGGGDVVGVGVSGTSEAVAGGGDVVWVGVSPTWEGWVGGGVEPRAAEAAGKGAVSGQVLVRPLDSSSWSRDSWELHASRDSFEECCSMRCVSGPTGVKPLPLPALSVEAGVAGEGFAIVCEGVTTSPSGRPPFSKV